MIIFWLYEKIDLIVSSILDLVGINPQHNEFLWIIGVVAVFILILYIIGYLIKTQLAVYVEGLFHDIPGFSTIKDIMVFLIHLKKVQTKSWSLPYEVLQMRAIILGLCIHKKKVS